MSNFARYKQELSTEALSDGRTPHRYVHDGGDVYQIKDSAGNVLRQIVAEERFMVSLDLKTLHSEAVSYNLKISVAYTSLENLARMWRDDALEETDFWETLPNHSDYSAYMKWRSELRDWPSKDNFRAESTKPVLNV